MRILWPEKRDVSEATSRGWYEDAVANGDANDLGVAPTIEAMANELDQQGVITLADEEVL